jgi:uncharacterized protein (DUF983 family)
MPAALVPPSPLTMVARALTRRCPHCGSHGLFTGWFHARERCPACGVRMLRGDESWATGTYLFNLVVSELLLMAVLAAVVVSTWPDPPWAVLQWGTLALMVVMPIFFYPFARLLFLAFDMMFRPVQPEELAGPRA